MQYFEPAKQGQKDRIIEMFEASVQKHDGDASKAAKDLLLQDEDGRTSFHWACANGHEQVARLLIEAKANVNAAAKDGWTALMVCCQNGQILSGQSLEASSYSSK